MAMGYKHMCVQAPLNTNNIAMGVTVRCYGDNLHGQLDVPLQISGDINYNHENELINGYNNTCAII